MHTPLPHRRIISKRNSTLAASMLIVAALIFGYVRYSQPIGSPVIHEVLTLDQPSETPSIAWPAAQASLGTVQDGILASKPQQTPQPTASTAKLITVLTVLKEKPLNPGESGPLLTIDQHDVTLYNDYFRAGGSLVAVQLGEQLTQYQMMQGILIRSGNNLADSLAIWAFGSLSNYQKAAQSYVDELDMKHTTIGTDASGLSSTTTSTADDLTLLGIAAMKHEVVREIVRQSSSNLPIDGIKPSTNWMLGQNGVIGIKTGNIPAVGGVFVIASEYAPEGEDPITVVGAVQGAPTTYDAIATAGRLTESIKPLFTRQVIVKKGTVVATIAMPWGEKSDIIAAEDISRFGWKYAPIETPQISLGQDTSFEQHAVLGTISVSGHTVDLIAASGIKPPSWQWRLTTPR